MRISRAEPSSRPGEQGAPVDLRRITKTLRSRIWDGITEILDSHASELLVHPPLFLVTAVWGTGRDGELTPAQKEIFDRAQMLLKETDAVLNIHGLQGYQQFALTFLVRELLISKILFFVEMGKNRLRTEAHDSEAADALSFPAPWGNA